MKKLLFFLTLLGLGAAGAAYWHKHRNDPEPVVAYTTAPVEYGTLSDTVSATGLLQPQDVMAVASPLSGEVVEIYPLADVNKVVREGDALLRLDDRMARQKVEEAEAATRLAEVGLRHAREQREAAEIKVTRLTELLKTIGQQKELDEARVLLKAAETNVKAAELKLDLSKLSERQAQLGLELTVVRVPTRKDAPTGAASPRRRFTILEKKVVAGQLIGPPASAQLFTLATDLGQMQAHAQVSENDIGKVRVGMEASFTVYAYSEEEARFRGQVVQIRPMPTSVHGAVFYDAVIDVNNEIDPGTREWRLRPGMTAAVDIVLRRHEGVWKVPTTALSFQLEDAYQTAAARAKLASWQNRPDRDDWRPVWVVGDDHKPWPVFVRIGGKTPHGDLGIKDGEFNEVLGWEPDLSPAPDPGRPSTHPRVITNAPPVKQGGLFGGKIKVPKVF